MPAINAPRIVLLAVHNQPRSPVTPIVTLCTNFDAMFISP
jgi:hypothetical protein